MKRIGARGSGKFEKITWDQAFDTLAHRLAHTRNTGHPELVVAIDGNRRDSSAALMVQRFVQVLGSPNYVRIPSMEDTYRTSSRLMMGREFPMAYDLENADFVLSFGSGLIDGWGAPGRVIHTWSLWHSGPRKGKTKIVQIEARASNTASKSDQWVAPQPGTEAALALGLAHVLIRDKLYDTDFVNTHAFGFEDWTTPDGEQKKGFKSLVLEKYSSQTVSEITGLEKKAIESLAWSYGKSKSPIALCGKGKGDFSGSLFEFMAIQSLNALAGNFNRKGGVMICDPIPLREWPSPELDAIARQGLSVDRLDQAGSKTYPFSASLVGNLAHTILADEKKSPVDTLILFASNPAYTIPDGGLFRSALKKIPYIVSFSPYKDDTALMADLVLPDHTYLEKREDVVWPSGLPYPLYGLTRPVVEPVYDTRQTGEAIIQLAKKMGGAMEAAFSWPSYESALKERAQGLLEGGGAFTSHDAARPVWKDFSNRRKSLANYNSFDEMWKDVKSNGMWYRPASVPKGVDGLFDSPSGKFEFVPSEVDAAIQELAREFSDPSQAAHMGFPGVGREESMEARHGEHHPEKEDRYPLVMVPYSLINLSSGWSPNPPFLNKTLYDHQLRADESFIEINPETANRYRLNQGDRVVIESQLGSVQARVNLFEGAMPGVIFMLSGLGHRGYDGYQYGKGENPNTLAGEEGEALSGNRVWWKTRVKVTKI
jgi:anaerobic selenocysteine-containing dehydrogenase